MTKQCITCKKERPITEFYYRKDTNRYKNTCKHCVCIRTKKYRIKYPERKRESDRKYYEANIEKIKEYDKSRTRTIKNSPERKKYLKQCKETNKKWRDENKKLVNGYSKKWKDKNKEKIKEYNKQYLKEHPELNRKYCRIRRARKNLVSEKYSIKDEQYTYKLFNNQCANCGSTENLCIDHHMPLSKGYALTRENAVLLCASCNSSKSAKLPKTFYTPEILQVIEEKIKPNQNDL